MVPDRTVYIVDDDDNVREFLQTACASPSCDVRSFPSADEFLEEYDDSGERPRCLILDVYLPGMSGPELHSRLVATGALIPVVLLTGAGDVPTAVESLQRGAIDFLEKPIDRKALLEAVERALSRDAQRRQQRKQRENLEGKLNALTRREQEVLEMLLDAKTNKQISATLSIGFQTAAKHRARVFKKLGVKSEVELVQLVAFVRAGGGVEDPANFAGKVAAGEGLANQPTTGRHDVGAGQFGIESARDEQDRNGEAG